MKFLGAIIIASFIFVSCGQNSNNQKELELKERELALKERQFALDSVQKLKSLSTESKTLQSEQANKTISKVVIGDPPIPIKARFINKNDKLILVVNGKEFVVIKDFGVNELNVKVDKSALAVCSIWGGSGGTSWTATLEKNGDIKVEELVQSRGGGETNADVNVVLSIKKGKY